MDTKSGSHTHNKQGDPLEILLVEDNPVDILAIRHGLQENHISCKLNVVEDGEEAIDFLYRRNKYETVLTPDLILLDLNLPKRSGREVLAEVKENPDLSHIPVIVLTTSEADKDIVTSYELHANCFITKPVGLNQFTELIKFIERFWLKVAKLPANES